MDPSIDRLRRQDLLIFSAIALLVIGVLMVQSASMSVGTGSVSTGSVGSGSVSTGSVTTGSVGTGSGAWSLTTRGGKQAIFAALAVVALLISSRLDYRVLLGKSSNPLRSPAVWAMAVAVIACLLVLVPGIGKEVNGARRWIALGPIQVQPSELAKWGTVVYLAWFLIKRPIPIDKFWTGFMVMVAPVAIVLGLVAKEDFGTAALIACCTLAMLVVGGAKLSHLLLVVPPALIAGGALVAGTPYRWRRMTSFLDPFADPKGEGYHMIQSLMSFASGGLSGTGLGQGVQKLGYLPEDTTDFIFAVVSEELGLAGAMLVTCLYLAFIVVAWRTLRSDRHDAAGKLLMFGGATMIVTQAIINIAVATVSVPTKGLSLPLISAGGTGLLITASAVGLLVSVIRTRPSPVVGESSGERSRPEIKGPHRQPRAVSETDWNIWTKPTEPAKPKAA